MPTYTPEYPDWKIAPPHVLEYNEKIREENRQAAEQIEEIRQRQREEIRLRELRVAMAQPPKVGYDGWEVVGVDDFTAEFDVELSFEEGDSMTVLSYKAPEGWLMARNIMGDEGLVPELYLQPVTSNYAGRSEPRFLRPKSVRTQGPGSVVTSARGFRSPREGVRSPRDGDLKQEEARDGMNSWLW